MFRSLSTCSKYMQVRLSGKSREREGGSQEGTLGLSQEKGFEQLCIMKVRESEALHAEAWLEGEQQPTQDADLSAGRLEAQGPRSQAAVGRASRGEIAFQPFSYHDPPG